MKSGGPWNLRGLRPEAREAARKAARQSGMSVGEWLNDVIQPEDDDDGALELDDFDGDSTDARRQQYPHDDRDGDYSGHNRRLRYGDRDRDRQRHGRRFDRNEQLARRERYHDDERAAAPRSRRELGEIHGRLDKLSHQIERLARIGEAKQRPPAPQRQAQSVETETPRMTGAPVQPRRAERPSPNSAGLTIDQAVAEITACQRALDGGEPTEAVASAAAPPLAPVAAPTFDLGGLEEQLREITARIETLRPARELEEAIVAVRADLADIARQLNEALPRRAVESLEIEVKSLAQRIDQSRLAGGDSTAIAGLERGLAEVRDVLLRLTTSENLAGIEDTVNGLARKLDQVVANNDPAALQQLEATIDALRSIVSHVASSDTLAKVADDVRALAAKVDEIANRSVTTAGFAALEQRIDTLTTALAASAEAGRSVPHELEKLLSGLIEKLEWVQLTHTDHAALAHLEDRIATLVKRLDASDTRFNGLEAVERGIADLLVHFDQVRGPGAIPAVAAEPAAVQAIEREVAEIKQIERRTQDSLEAVQDTVEHVVDRLAMIESDMRHEPEARAELKQPTGKGPQPETVNPETVPLQPKEEPEADEVPPALPVPGPAPMVPAPAPTTPATVQGAPASSRTAARRPIDPSLPPDHPLEPGSTAGRTRSQPSAADRIAASEAAAVASASKPPVIPDPGGKSNFIAAARRAAQAAAATPSDIKPKAEAAATPRTASKAGPQRTRKLLVACAAVLIVLGCLRIASRMFDDGSSSPTPATSDKASAPAAAVPDAKPAEAAPTPPAEPSAPPETTAPPNSSPPAAPAATPQRQSNLTNRETTAGARPAWIGPDVTGSLPAAAPLSITPAPVAAPSLQAPPMPTASDTLPATIGGPALRAAAMGGEPGAAYEVAIRFADGRGVRQNSEEAARWLDRAAKQGLAPAQFRLGTFYEKGIGVKKDLAMARDLYIGAAKRGNGKAMHNLAVLYAEGINGPPDYRAAARWFREAANHGIADSQYNLGILYARGIGVEQNLAESYKWFALAADQGDKEAAKKRDELAAKLDQQSLAAAQNAIKTWTAMPQPDEAINVKAPPGGWDLPATGAQSPKAKPRASSTKAVGPDVKAN